MKTINVKGVAYSDKAELGTIEVQDYPKQKKIQKMAIRLGIWWTLALFAILIPVLHFILVPLFFILGIVFAVDAVSSKQEIVGGHIKCPHCGKDMSIKVGPLAFPHREICQGCAATVTMESQ